MDSFTPLKRRLRRHFLPLAILAAVIFTGIIYNFSLHFTSWSKSPTVDEQPIPPSVPLDEWTGPLPQQPECPVLVLSMLYGAHKMYQLEAALETHQRHAERWGCAFESLDYELTSRKLYSKEYFLLSKLLYELEQPEDSRRQWLMWVDADSIVVNPAIPLDAFLPPDNLQNVFALVTADHQGLNNGVFYLKVDRASVDLLTSIIDYPLAHPDEDLGWFGEQRAMENVINAWQIATDDDISAPKVAWVPRFWFNTFEWEHAYEGEPGHFMVHFAGLAETRVQHMADWLDELQRNQAKWEIPLEETFYAADIPRYWKEFAANATIGRP